VLKSDGVLAVSAYNLLQIEPLIDEVVNRYYHDVIGPFWMPERKLVENFADVPFPFHEIRPPKFAMTAQWDLDRLVGYLRTWSSSQRFVEATGSDPVEQIIDELRAAWRNPEQTREVIWPLTLRVGVNQRSGLCLARRSPGEGRSSTGYKRIARNGLNRRHRE
jgi:hypothetical protein